MIGRDTKYREDMNDTGVRICVLTVGVSAFLLLFVGFYNASAQALDSQVIDEQVLEAQAEPDITPPTQPVVEFVTSQGQFPPVFSLHAEDSGSGISHFLIGLEDGRQIRVHENQLVSGDFGLDPAIYLMSAQAIDNAGNRSGSTFNLIVPPAPTPAVLSAIPQRLYVGEGFLFEGSAQPDSTIIAQLTSVQGDVPATHTVEIPVDANGSFGLQLRPQLAPGAYRIAAKIRTTNNQLSAFTRPSTIVIDDAVALGSLRLAAALVPILLIVGFIGVVGFIVVLVILLLRIMHRQRLKQSIASELK